MINLEIQHAKSRIRNLKAMASPRGNSATDDNSADENTPQQLVQVEPLSGTLYKWTNYIHGWQKRYFTLIDGTLAYYKSQKDTAYGCRGAIAVFKAKLRVVTDLLSPAPLMRSPTTPLEQIQRQPPTTKKASESDECRLDVSVGDAVWYLRTETAGGRKRWVATIKAHKGAESGYGSAGELRRHGSAVSLASQRSLASANSAKRSGALQEKLAELETFREIVCRQVDSLQAYFDACASLHGSAAAPSLSEPLVQGDDSFASNSVSPGAEVALSAIAARRKQLLAQLNRPATSQSHRRAASGGNAGAQLVSDFDFHGEAMTFKATTAGIVATLQHCAELLATQEQANRKRVEKEVERRRKAESRLKQSEDQQQQHRQEQIGGPDYQEGPNSPLSDEVWHDALDAVLEQEEREEARLERLLSHDEPKVKMADVAEENVLLSKQHPLYEAIEQATRESLKYALSGVEPGEWQLFAVEGEMKMYKREVEIDGVMNDPLKAIHQVKGITAHEFLHYFFEVDYKMDWDTTLEWVKLVEKPSSDMAVVHQLHKRVWPSAQRESLFWSHMRRCDASRDSDAHDLYIVCNRDYSRDDVPMASKGNVRVGLQVAMVCQTILEPHAKQKPVAQLNRNDFTCRIVYVAQVSPGGWVPSSAARAIYKREYPKFLRLLTKYILSKTDGQPVKF